MAVCLTTHKWDRFSYITYVYDHAFLLFTKHNSQASIVLKERGTVNKFQLVLEQIETCHGFLNWSTVQS